MPRFYFDLIDHDGQKAVDPEGVDLADLEAAKAEALRGLGSMTRDELWGGHPASFSIDIRSADEVLCTVKLFTEMDC